MFRSLPRLMGLPDAVVELWDFIMGNRATRTENDGTYCFTGVGDRVVMIVSKRGYATFRDPPMPGLVIGGRFPIHIWPRSLMWAFDWHDPTKDLVLKRGEPWFYLRFEANDPSRPVRLVEAEMTPELREYCQGLDGVTNYVNQSYQLFKTAEERRPTTLLKKKERA